MNREQFLEYVNHFNNKRYDAVTSYFTPDITVEYGSVWGDRTLHGPQEFIDSYRSLHETIREVLELGDFMECGDLMFVELYTEFHCFKDSPESNRLALKKGEASVMTNWVLYNFEGDKMKRIRIAHFRKHNPMQAKY
jgi:hypothetical protein